MFDSLTSVLLLLTSSVLAIALFRALRLPAMLAYFVVGMLFGPSGFNFLPSTESGRHVAEFVVGLDGWTELIDGLCDWRCAHHVIYRDSF